MPGWLWAVIIIGLVVLLGLILVGLYNKLDPPPQPLGERVGAGRRAAEEAARPDPEPRRGGEGLRRARARGVRRGDEGPHAGDAGAGHAATGPGGGDPLGRARQAVRRRRGLSAAPRDGELPAAPGAAERRSSRTSPSPARCTTTPCCRTTMRSRRCRRASSAASSTSSRVSTSSSRTPRPAKRPRSASASSVTRRRAVLLVSLAAALALLVPGAAQAKSYTLPRGGGPGLGQPRRLAPRARADHVRLLRAVHRRVPRHPAAQGRARRHGSASPRTARRYRPGREHGARAASTQRGRSASRRAASESAIVWHYSALDERRVFTITYRFRGLAVAYDDVVDVNMKVWGAHWPVGVSELKAAMALPRAGRAREHALPRLGRAGVGERRRRPHARGVAATRRERARRTSSSSSARSSPGACSRRPPARGS